VAAVGVAKLQLSALLPPSEAQSLLVLVACAPRRT
jgi:hypothetical protein